MESSPPVTSGIRALLRQALAFAYAALDDAQPLYVSQARRYASAVLPRAASLHGKGGMPLGDAHEVVTLASQLRRVMELLEHKVGSQGHPTP